ncbi:hypothetical protein EJC51_44940 [Streptomyces aquilus]|uniref:Uncharacterized protein n=1 Tax=Streptomyces aquilus TaxID=2548456 RepID=A0A3Q9C7E8_9ACTN|nr:hypothetical protein [Streptomyces aquilus]AZP22591.1 hypothetical protein EJC51_44940 [Streptomyces aquilus]
MRRGRGIDWRAVAGVGGEHVDTQRGECTTVGTEGHGFLRCAYLNPAEFALDFPARSPPDPADAC